VSVRHQTLSRLPDTFALDEFDWQSWYASLTLFLGCRWCIVWYSRGIQRQRILITSPSLINRDIIAPLLPFLLSYLLTARRSPRHRVWHWSGFSSQINSGRRAVAAAAASSWWWRGPKVLCDTHCALNECVQQYCQLLPRSSTTFSPFSTTVVFAIMRK